MSSIEEKDLAFRFINEIEESMDSMSIKSENSLSEKERTKKGHVNVELIEYSIISKHFGENDKIQLIFLPTPESIEKLMNSKIVRDLIQYNINKYKSYFKASADEEENENDNDTSVSVSAAEEKLYLDLDKVPYINNITMLSIVLVFLGGINSQNDIYSIFPNETPQNPNENCFVDKTYNYLYYIYHSVEFLRHQQISFPFSDLNFLFKSLDEIGFHIQTNNKNILYRSIKDNFMSLLDNKILVVIAPSNNFWIKSESNIINGVNYDKKLNNCTNIFYNKLFIKKFLTKIAKHPRCNLCLISSMIYKNLKAAIDGLDVQFSEYLPKKYAIVSQEDHDVIGQNNKKEMPLFYRNMEKIIKHLKQVEKWDYFDEKNIVILEGDKNKISESTESNTICSYLFSEEFLSYDLKRKYEVEKEGNRLINYVVDLLENCPNDVRDYISHNSIVNYFSEDKNTKNNTHAGNNNASNTKNNTENNTEGNNESNNENNTKYNAEDNNENNTENNTENNAQDTN